MFVYRDSMSAVMMYMSLSGVVFWRMLIRVSLLEM